MKYCVPGKNRTVSSGNPALDRQLGGGFFYGGVYIIGGRPGMGKTALALDIAGGMEGGVLFVSLDMSAEGLMNRYRARRREGNADFIDSWEETKTTSGLLVKGSFAVYEPVERTTTEIVHMASALPNLSAVLIDYLQLLSFDGDSAELVGELKNLALSLDVPVIVCSQLSRAPETREDKHPRLSDLRCASCADCVLLLYRRGYYHKESGGSPPILECEVAKNRFGQTGMVHLFCDSD